MEITIDYDQYKGIVRTISQFFGSFDPINPLTTKDIRKCLEGITILEAAFIKRCPKLLHTPALHLLDLPLGFSARARIQTEHTSVSATAILSSFRGYAVPQDEQFEVVPAADQIEVAPQDEQFEVVPQDEQFEAVPQDEQFEVVPQDEQFEVVPAADQIEVEEHVQPDALFVWAELWNTRQKKLMMLRNLVFSFLWCLIDTKSILLGFVAKTFYEVMFGINSDSATAITSILLLMLPQLISIYLSTIPRLRPTRTNSLRTLRLWIWLIGMLTVILVVVVMTTGTPNTFETSFASREEAIKLGTEPSLPRISAKVCGAFVFLIVFLIALCSHANQTLLKRMRTKCFVVNNQEGKAVGDMIQILINLLTPLVCILLWRTIRSKTLFIFLAVNVALLLSTHGFRWIPEDFENMTPAEIEAHINIGGWFREKDEFWRTFHFRSRPLEDGGNAVNDV